MFVNGSTVVGNRRLTRRHGLLFHAVICILAALHVALAGAETNPGNTTDSGATTDTYHLPTTGTLTAKQIGDGVWWRPELNETSITQVLSDLESWNIRNLYLDVFRSGHTLYPSDLFPQRVDAAGRDWFSYILRKAHARNIRVHAWAQVLCWHDAEDESHSTHPLLEKHPAWQEVSVDGFAIDGKTAARFVSPAVPEVQEALALLAAEICRYPVDGLNLDAVEYNNHIDSGYNAAAVSGFEAESGEEPSSLRIDMDTDSGWMKWVTYREEKLTSVVQVMALRAREAAEWDGRRVVVSAVVQPGYSDTRGLNRRYQNWKQWLDMQLLDATIPACFETELPELEQQLWEARSEHMGSKVACLPGLQIDSGDMDAHPPLKEQKRLLRNAGFQFCTVMDYAGLRHAMENPETEPEERGGFWDFLSRD